MFTYELRTETAEGNSMTVQLHLAKVLKALKPRKSRDPYWGAPLARGRHVGYRKIAADKATWIARRWSVEEGKYRFQSLGVASDAFGYDQAKKAAEEWFKLQESGVTTTSEVVTVADACRAYVKSLTLTNGEKSGRDANLRLRRTLYDSALGKRALATVRITHIKGWRDGLGLNPENSNRTLRSFKAALNMAVDNRQCVASLAKEWNEVKPLPSEKKRRTLYLDLDQRRRLLDHCGDGSFRDFIEAAMLTGARGGELADAKCSQFDARSSSMTFIGKTRLKIEPRTVPISAPAVALFKRLAKGKKPDDLLFMRDESIMGAAFCDIETRHYHGLAKIEKPVRWLSYDWGGMVKQAVIAADLPHSTTHYTLRHSWISAALGSGMSTLDVARLTGTSLLMIEKHYGHLVDGAARLKLAAVAML
jgi:integrase